MLFVRRFQTATILSIAMYTPLFTIVEVQNATFNFDNFSSQTRSTAAIKIDFLTNKF